MRVHRHHLVFSGALVAVVLQLAFAVALLVDATQTNRTYDALAAHRVAVAGTRLGCAYVGATGRTTQQFSTIVCRYRYHYGGQTFTMVVPAGANATAYVEPDNPALRMSKIDFDGGPREIVVDVVVASVLLAGSLMVATLHERHRRRRRRRTRAAH